MIVSVLRRLQVCRQGNFGMLTVLLMPVLIGAVGVSIDFSRAYLARNALQSTADAALLASISSRSMIMAAALRNTNDGIFNVPPDEVEAFFNSRQRGDELAEDIAISGITAEKRDSMLHASLIFRATVPTTLLRILGQENIDVAGVTTVTTPLPQFRDYYVLLDNSPSMGVAATLEDIDRMEQKTIGRCAFACHTTGPIDAGNTATDDSNYQIARVNNIRLRIDLLRSAMHQMVETAEDERAYGTQYRFSMYNLGSQISDARLTLLSDMAYPSSSLSGDLDKLQLMTLRKGGERHHAGTELYAALSELMEAVGMQGAGHSSADAIKTVIIATDGVENSMKKHCTKPKVGNTGVCQEPIDKICEAAKKKGINIAILYTTYLPLPRDGWYKQWIKPFQSEIRTRLRTCASEKMFIEASFDDDLGEAMSTLFKTTLGGPRLTQ